MDIEMSTQQTFREGSVSQRIIEPLHLYDPLLVLLKVKLRLNDWWLLAVWWVLVLGLLLMVAAIIPIDKWDGRVFFSPLQLLDFSAAYLILVGTYLSLPSAMADFFNRLWENVLIGDDRTDIPGSRSYLEFVEQQVRWIHSRWWGAIALLVAALNPLFLLFVHPEIASGLPLWMVFFGLFIVLVGNYAIVLVLAWLVMIAVITHQLFRGFTFRVKPLHPDGSGGLGLFNRLLWISTPLIVIAGCSIPAFWGSASSLFDRIFLLGDILFYLLAASLLLRAWLVLPHQAMVQARNRLLHPLTNEYERALGETMSGTMSDATAVNEGTERLVALRKRHEEVHSGFPTWPIEIMQLRGLVTLLILPVLLALLPFLLDLFAKK
ncbi:MAG TPA: hypothetical protein VL485_17905 [Ktedonobacteraceae bacterium]|nr:hypothetical protein [Ktedonobacteraceae bacterium]